jgi:hypothetical protein
LSPLFFAMIGDINLIFGMSVNYIWCGFRTISLAKSRDIQNI